ncbi:hypothetical protein M413DRAFT_444734 [Hebeloma cylindrosporum]|uniref:SWR1-complex protein 5 n=1 Tax=Hebeloma cylindrosporum TaxID=76867 RepID=A0A0C2XXC9_HEBCY|nr:hypothetical protein M413DRAFT_444734 [Hebeloma cylindrosporum h7]
MTLLSQHVPHNSDSDSDDEDYVPSDENKKDDSDSEASDDEGSAKGLGETEPPPTVVDQEEKKRARDALWADFQASAAAGPSKSPNGRSSQQPRMVKVERRYRFAGEDVIDVVEVPEDSPEATKWPLWKDPSTLQLEEPKDASTTASIPPLTEQAQTTSTPTGMDTTSPDSSPPNPITNASTTSTSQTPDPSSTPKPPLKRPGPRKPKTALAPLPGSTKAKKLTTLDKSAMDWQRHIQTEQQAGSSLKDELDANRRAGGYLEKVEFLKRVEERKEENLDAIKSNKRRRL